MTFTAGQKVRASEMTTAVTNNTPVPAYGQATDAVGASTVSTTFVDVGVAVTLTVSPGGVALVYMGAIKRAATTSTTSYLGVALSGANTVVADTTNAVIFVDANMVDAGFKGRLLRFTGLTAGSTTFTGQYRGTAAGTFSVIDTILRVVTF